MSDNEFEKEFVEATERGKASLESLPKALTARYDQLSKRLVLELQNGATLLVPINLIQGLDIADEKALADFDLVLGGSQIHWHSLDVQIYIKSLVEGVFGTPLWMQQLKKHYSSIGAKGGAARTTAKIAASRKNGKKGGRPRRILAA